MVLVLLSRNGADSFPRHCDLGTAWCCQNLGNLVDVEIGAESLESVSSKFLLKLDLENFIASGMLTSVQ